MKKKTKRKLKIEILSVLGSPLLLLAVIALSLLGASAVIGVMMGIATLVSSSGLIDASPKDAMIVPVAVLMLGALGVMLYHGYRGVKEELTKRIK